MAEPRELITAEALKAMSVAERAALIDQRLITDLSTLDERTAKVVARGRDRVLSRLQDQT